MPKSVLRYELDKVRYLDLESYLIPVLFSQIKRLMVEIELNLKTIESGQKSPTDGIMVCQAL